MTEPHSDDTHQSPSSNNSTISGERAICFTTPQYLTFVRKGRRRYDIGQNTKLRNSLLFGVGLLELGNAGDFAANVWNQIPIPTYVIVLMAIGATIAVLISAYAFRDAKLSLDNIRLLRKERNHLRTLHSHHTHDAYILPYLDARLDVNFREIGTEIIDRVGMDILMGLGGILVGIGTYMAIGGANRRIWAASNLISGYVGNSPPAVYGVVNVVWSFYMVRREQIHYIAGAKRLGFSHNTSLLPALKRRVRVVQRHALINGTTGIVASVASLITATHWWGYVMLAPCIVSSVYCNCLWRWKIGYNRPVLVENISAMETVDKISLVEELSFVLAVREMLVRPLPEGSLQRLLGQQSTDSLSVITFLYRNDLFQDFCLFILSDYALSESIFGTPLPDKLTITPHVFLSLSDVQSARLLEIAQSCVDDVGPSRFQDRERYLVEMLGCYLRLPEVEHGEKGPEKAEGENLSTIV